jgi:hypothetical protein
MNISPERLLATINRARGLALVLGARYAGGEQGAYALAGPDGARLVLKYSADPATLARYRHGARVADRLREAGYPAPRYLYTGRAAGASYVILEELPGAPLRELAAAQVPALLEFNKLQAGRGGRGGRGWPAEIASTVLEGRVGFCVLATMRAHSAATSQLLDRLQAIVAAHASDVRPAGDVVHLDFSPANILAEGGRISGVIDWEGAGTGDRGFDLATLLFYCYDTPGVREPLLRQARELSGAGALRVYLAHMILRQTEWAARFYGQAEVDRWLARAELVLGGEAFA